jgi:Cdc6-like AAA superfamily ATPase
VKVLEAIENWVHHNHTCRVYWLNGVAGTGKTTIAQTLAERMFAEGFLGASFICSRDFPDRRDLHFIFPTLAFQLAHRYPTFRAQLVRILTTNPKVGHESLSNQLSKLLVEPLRSTGLSTVIVIDALDECEDDQPPSAILSLLSREIHHIPSVKFFITGRPEPQIRSGFRLPTLHPQTEIFLHVRCINI